jgi:hypothetical protein
MVIMVHVSDVEFYFFIQSPSFILFAVTRTSIHSRVEQFERGIAQSFRRQRG